MIFFCMRIFNLTNAKKHAPDANTFFLSQENSKMSGA